MFEHYGKPAGAQTSASGILITNITLTVKLQYK